MNEILIDVFVIFCGLYAIIYIFAAMMISAGERRFRSGELPSDLPDVSVIVCARNEEHGICRCIESLQRLDYPREKLEILLVDDESEDRTLEIINDYSAKNSIIKILSTEEEPCSFPGKQRPLELSLRNAKGEIVILTDADCAVAPGWIKAHVMAYHENTGIVGGITAVSSDSGGLFSPIQNCDQVSKLAVAMGCAGLNVPLTIMGNNMSFRRRAYDECGGFSAIGPAIVEDVELMYAITRNSSYSPGWAAGNESVVVSTREKNFRAFIEQRYRMLGVMKKVPLFGKILLGIEILMAFLFGTALLVMPWDLRPFAAAILTWICGTYLVLLPAPGITSKDLLCIPGMLLFQVVYGIVLCFRFLLGRKKVTWKGREYG
ncbi:MAG: glycosyltransferase [Candidatus Latescibacteria bacterium]|jgi:cellulose synthase/poly-beta-1,6-N-acetylglucosamine synthase-like glycosyltransferase|nr:glycosyltransferase [Candidatus Latescibacterota bacterium]